MIDEQVFILHPERTKIAETARIDRWVKIEGTVTIGDCVHIASFSHIGAGGGEIVFGDHSGCSSHVVIAAGMPDLHYMHISAADERHNQHPIRSKVVIGRHVVIFANATVLPGTTIGDGAVIAAGSVVTKDVPAWEVWGGCPAKKLRDRPMDELLDVDEYWALAQGAMTR